MPIRSLAPAIGESSKIESQMKPGGGPDMQASALGELQQSGPMPAELGKVRLEACHRVAIPRSSSKLLFPESALSRSLVAESYRRARTGLLQSQAKAGMRSVCITSAIAGEGKTITSMNIGLCCSQVPTIRVLLVDADLRTAGLSELMGCRREPGLSELLGRAVSYEKAIAAADVSNLYLLPAGRAASAPRELFAGTEWKELVAWATKYFNIIIVDTPPILPLADTELILAGCDSVVLVARVLRTSREMVRKAIEKCESKKLLGTILNGTDGARHHYEYYGELGDPARPKPRPGAKVSASGVR